MLCQSKNKKSHIFRARRIVVAVLAIVFLSMSAPSLLTGQNPKSHRIVTQPANATVKHKSTAKPANVPEKGASSGKINVGPVPKIEPKIPKANRYDKQHVFLEKADVMHKNDLDTFIIVSGNVEFSHGPTFMYCDSAHFYPGSESLDAFGNVRMRQGDTLFIYADELNYRGLSQKAYLYGTDREPVRMINRDVTLRTPSFTYDLAAEFGYYNEGGILTDKKNRLTSVEGEYIPGTKDASFFSNVVLNSRSDEDTLVITTDTLYYNTLSHIAIIDSKDSEIINAQGTIYTSFGTYNTNDNIANLYNRSLAVASTGATLQGDTLFYDRNKGFGEAFGNMVITDSAHSVILTGDYGYYNEVVDSAFASGNALAREYSQGDTLYLHGKYLYGFATYDSIFTPEDTILGTPASARVDTSYVMIAHPRVRFYRSDVQGICDSMRFQQADSMLYMHHHPVVWSDQRQVWGNVIQLHFNDSTVERATLPDYGYTAEYVDFIMMGNRRNELYNQLSGKELIAYFTDGQLTRVDVNGNVESIMIPQENDSTYNKIVNVESSFMTADFDNQQILRAKMWPETSGTVTPLFLAKKSLFYLPKFKWYADIRPNSPEDVMVIPEGMEQLMADIPATTIIPRRRVNDEGQVETVPPEEYPTESEKATSVSEKIEADPKKAKAEPEKIQADPEKAKADPEKAKADSEKIQAEPEKIQADSEKAKAEPEKIEADPDRHI